MSPHMSRVIGHRGYAGIAPENTLASIREAARAGCKWIEADATVLADGTVILFHDDELDRTTNGTGLITDCTYAELRHLDAGSWKGEDRFVREPIPLLSDALVCCQALGMGFNVELKTHGDDGLALAQAVSDVITKCDHGPLLISSFDHDALEAYSGPEPKGLLYDELPEGWEETAQRLGAVSVHLWNEPLFQDHVDAVKATGREVYVFTVNEPADLKVTGIDGVFSDFPDRV